jgi:hypothetical protein
LSLSSTKPYGRMDTQIHVFLTSTEVGGNLASCYNSRTAEQSLAVTGFEAKLVQNWSRRLREKKTLPSLETELRSLGRPARQGRGVKCSECGEGTFSCRTTSLDIRVEGNHQFMLGEKDSNPSLPDMYLAGACVCSVVRLHAVVAIQVTASDGNRTQIVSLSSPVTTDWS